MTKELEALKRGILEFEKELEDDCNNEWLKRVVAGMKKCYQRLEAIDNSNPSEALECLEYLYCNPTDYNSNDRAKDYDTIKQALLKAQEQEEDIIHYKGTVANLRRDNALLKELNAEHKPKQYLKWEDLEFKEEEQWLKVKMGNNFYRMEWVIDGFGANVVSLYKYITNDYLMYCSCIKENGKQFFNDLHLERVEE